MSDLPDELPSDPAELRVFAAALYWIAAPGSSGCFKRKMRSSVDPRKSWTLISYSLFWRISRPLTPERKSHNLQCEKRLAERSNA